MRTTKRRGVIRAVALLALVAWGTSRADVRVASPPGVLVLRTRATPEVERREEALFDQLSIALDDFAVLLISPPKEDFHRLPLPEQVAMLVPVAQAEEAVAVVWLAIPAPRQVMVHLIAQSTGRTLVKTVEATTGPQAETTLALVVRELLGAAYLFERPTELARELRPVVAQVRTQVAPPTPVAPAPPSPPQSWRVALSSAARFGAQQGGPFRFGAQVARGFNLGPVVLSPALELAAGPLEWGPLSVMLAEVSAGFELFVPITRGVALGPFADAQAGVRWQQAAREAERTTTFAPSVVFHVGLRLDAPLAPGLRVAFDVALGARPIHSRLMSGDQLLWSEGWGELRMGFAVQWEVH